MVSIRRMGQAGERNLTIVLWFLMSSALFALGAFVRVWVTPAARPRGADRDRLISGVSQLLMTEGYRSGEATMLAPFEYGAIVYTVLLGWLFWGEVPGIWELSGSGSWSGRAADLVARGQPSTASIAAASARSSVAATVRGAASVTPSPSRKPG